MICQRLRPVKKHFVSCIIHFDLSNFTQRQILKVLTEKFPFIMVSEFTQKKVIKVASQSARGRQVGHKQNVAGTRPEESRAIQSRPHQHLQYFHSPQPPDPSPNIQSTHQSTHQRLTTHQDIGGHSPFCVEPYESVPPATLAGLTVEQQYNRFNPFQVGQQVDRQSQNPPLLSSPPQPPHAASALLQIAPPGDSLHGLQEPRTAPPQAPSFGQHQQSYAPVSIPHECYPVTDQALPHTTRCTGS